MSVTSRPAKIISFCSARPGVGRTMTLANVAWILASNGKNVLVIDWDLEDPGLHRYYGDYLPFPDLSQGSTGVLEMFTSFAAAADRNKNRELLSALYDEHANFDRYRITLQHEFPQGGRLSYIGPGRIDAKYHARVRAFGWEEFLVSDDGREFLEELRSRMHGSEYDYILIDSRSGLSDSVGVCTLALPDTVVICLTLHQEAIEGAQRIAGKVRLHPRPVQLQMLPVRVDSSDNDRFERTLMQARRALDPFLDVKGERALQSYWGEVMVPYNTYFTFGEELAVMVQTPLRTEGVLASYIKAAKRISGGAVDGFEAVSQAQRDQYRLRFRVNQALAPKTVSILNALEDQMWADWISEQLRQVGFRVLTVQPDDRRSSGSLPDSDFLLLLLSPRLRDTPAGRTVEALIDRTLVATRPEQEILGLRVSQAQLVAGLDWPNATTLSGPSEELARTALLNSIGLRTDVEPPPASPTAPRYPGRQPEAWRVPTRTANFTGRVQLFNSLRQQFRFGATGSSTPQVLWGIRGVGKKQVALEYAHRFGSEYDIVWWIPASDPDTMRTSLTALAQRMNKVSGGRRTGDDLESLLDDLRQGEYLPRWLLVFDSAANEESVAPFIPTGGAGHVLITSTNPTWPNYVTQQVEVFTPEESLSFLASRLSGVSAAELSRLAERVGHLPLLEAIAAASLRRFPQPVDEYISFLDRGAALSSEDHDPDYQAFVTATQMAYESVQELAPAAARLLDLCSFMSPDGVGMRIIQSRPMLSLLAQVDDSLEEEAMRLGPVLKALTSPALAVVDHTTSRLKVHRAVQDLVRRRMSEEEQRENRAMALHVLASMRPSDIERDYKEHRPVFAELDEHVIVSQAMESREKAVHAWLVSQVRYRWFWGQWSAGRELGLRILDRWRETLRETHPYVLRMESQVAAACRMLGRYNEALELSFHAVDGQRDRQDRDEYELAVASRGYAADLRAVGRFKKAYEEDRQTHRTLVELIGADMGATLSASANLALSKFYMESIEAALNQDRQTWEIRRQVLGEDNHQFWLSHADLGTYYRQAGDHAAAEKHLTEAMAQLSRVLERDSHHTLEAQAGLGMTEIRAGKVQEGQDRVIGAHKAFERQWGPSHPRTMSLCLARAAAVHADELTNGDVQGEATGWAEEVLHRYEAMHGPDHPFTSICHNNLAFYYLDFGDVEKATRHARKAASQLIDSLGRNHRYTLVARMNKNNCLHVSEEGSRSDRVDTDEEIYEGCRQSAAWGTEHQITLTAMANLAASRSPDDAHPDDTDRLTQEVRAEVAEHIPEGHWLAAALVARPYRRVGADLEVLGV